MNFPCVTGRIRRVILRRGFLYVARPAKGLQIGEFVWNATALQRLNMVAFEPAGLATLAAPPAVPREDLQAEQCPPPRVELPIMPGAWMLATHPTIAERRRPVGFGARASAPAASTNAAATSSRPQLFVPRFASRTDPASSVFDHRGGETGGEQRARLGSDR